MRFSLAVILPLIAASLNMSAAASDKVTVEVLHKPENCARKTSPGDTIEVHYRGTLAADGSEFDASYKRGQPLSFTVGQGQVIKG